MSPPPLRRAVSSSSKNAIETTPPPPRWTSSSRCFAPVATLASRSTAEPPGDVATRAYTSGAAALDRQARCDPVALSVRVVPHVPIPELDQPVRDDDGAVATGVGAVDDNRRGGVGDP